MACRYLRKLHPELLFRGGKKGDTLLHQAVASKDLDLVKELVQYCDTLIDFENHNEQTPLQLAIEFKLSHAVEIMITHHRESIYQITKKGETLLHLAVAAGDLHILLCLVAVSPCHILEKQDQFGNTALLDAVRNRSLDMVKTLVDACPAVVDISKSAILLSALHCNTILTYLIDACPHVIGHKFGKSQKNLLHFVSDVNMAKKLLEIEPNLINETTTTGRCVLHSTLHRDEMLEFLLSYKPNLLLHRDDNNRSALHRASQCGYEDAVNKILTFQPDLIDTYNGNTVLHAAVQADDSEVIALVFSNRISNIWCENNEHKTPLALAVERDNRFVVRMFTPHVLLEDALKHRESSFGPYLHARCEKECETLNNYLLTDLSKIVFEYVGLITTTNKRKR